MLGVTREVIEAEADHPDRCGIPRLVCAVQLLADRVEPALDRLHATVVVIEEVEREDWPKTVVPEMEAKKDRRYGANL